MAFVRGAAQISVAGGFAGVREAGRPWRPSGAVGSAGADDLVPAFRIIFSAEAHGALLACDCPLQLIGGVARRSTLIQSYRARGPVLVVDAGNWASGGLYDDESDGDPVRDRLRTELMARAMARMGYDFVG